MRRCDLRLWWRVKVWLQCGHVCLAREPPGVAGEKGVVGVKDGVVGVPAGKWGSRLPVRRVGGRLGGREVSAGYAGVVGAGWFRSAGSVVELGWLAVVAGEDAEAVAERLADVEAVDGVSPDVSIADAAVAILGSPERFL